jgi:hypothetical protein
MLGGRTGRRRDDPQADDGERERDERIERLPMSGRIGAPRRRPYP